MKNERWKKVIVVIIFSFLVGAIFFFGQKQETPKPEDQVSLPSPEEKVVEPENITEANQKIKNNLKSPPKESLREALPDFILYDVPFTSQAPYADWSQPWQDACEEAAVLMAMKWAHSKKSLTKKEAKKEILELIEFQNRIYGDYHDTSAADTAKLMREFYKYDSIEVRYNISTNDIKKELAQGNLVITPMAGRLLGNPYFTSPGPQYHMLLFRGYDEKNQEFIVNDAGTRRGEGLRYSYKVIQNAIHDWTGSKETILQGQKAMIVIRR